MTTQAGETEKEAGKKAAVAPFRLQPFFSPRPWGRTSLLPWYAETGTAEPVGEAWMTGPQSEVATGDFAGRRLDEVVADQHAVVLGAAWGEREFPLLVKILFPADKLSVQVHPDDEQAQRIGQPRGKTECWYVLEAEPGAAVMLGLKPGTTIEQVRSAITDGSLEQRMQSVPVAVGDMLFVDAGTVHAIGPGVVLLETQQTSDTTYRMFDYGRPRELHVEQGLAVTKLATRAGKVPPRTMDGFTRLIAEQYFSVDRFDLHGSGEGVWGSAEVRMTGPGCLVGLTDGLRVWWGETAIALPKGTAMVVPAGSAVRVEAEGHASFIRSMAPAAAARD